MFAGVMDVLIGFMLLPIFVIAHAIRYILSRSHGATCGRSAGLAILMGLLVHLPSVCVTWYLLYGWHKVLRAG
jgi:hypothetical protein